MDGESPAAPNMFFDELARALLLLADIPFIGKSHRHRAVPGLRRYLLRGSRYHVYYVVQRDVVVVIAVWGAIRGITPRFTDRKKRLEDPL